jgi:hypothetical protein
MTSTDSQKVKTLGLFEKRIQGDDCLMQLAQRRFAEAGMGAEMHAAKPEQLDWSLKFKPGEKNPVVVHLPREFDLAQEQTRNRILEFARTFAGQVYGLVIHDHAAMALRRNDYVGAAWKLDEQLEKIDHCPMLFVEYAAGLEPTDFAQFFSAIRDLDRVSACIDIGHVGIWTARAAYARKHPSEDVCALKSQGPRLRQFIGDVEEAVAAGPMAVLELLEAIAKLNKPVHFHLHDGHPLSTFSPFGVSDHLGFEVEIPINFEYLGRRTLPTMYGTGGLTKVVGRALELLDPRMLSFTLEIHPAGGRLALGDAAALFQHWTDKTNAEQMNHWLALLQRNHQLLREAIQVEMTTPEEKSNHV